MRIMYVEDNMVNLALVERVARMGGHTIVSFTNGVEALNALKTDKADLILMDIELEGALDGMEVTRQLRARGDKRPIIAVTAYAMRGDRERILESGCDAYLPKPIPIAEFLELLAQFDPANAKPEPVESADSDTPIIVRGGTAPLEPLADTQPSPAVSAPITPASATSAAPSTEAVPAKPAEPASEAPAPAPKSAESATEKAPAETTEAEPSTPQDATPLASKPVESMSPSPSIPSSAESSAPSTEPKAAEAAGPSVTTTPSSTTASNDSVPETPAPNEPITEPDGSKTLTEVNDD